MKSNTLQKRYNNLSFLFLKISHLVYFLINNCAISHITYYILFCIKHIALCYLVFSREQSFYNNNFFRYHNKVELMDKVLQQSRFHISRCFASSEHEFLYNTALCINEYVIIKIINYRSGREPIIFVHLLQETRYEADHNL